MNYNYWDNGWTDGQLMANWWPLQLHFVAIESLESQLETIKEKIQFPNPLKHNKKTATAKTREQMVHGLRSNTYPIRYKTTNITWFCRSVAFVGFGIRSTGINHWRQYMTSITKRSVHISNGFSLYLIFN